MNYETAKEIEVAVAFYFKPTINIIVPNIADGMFLHECDLLIMTPSGCMYEVEIKISKSDLRADKKKDHHHNSMRIRKLWFAIPRKLCTPDCFELIPGDAGILSVEPNGCVNPQRTAPTRNNYKATDAERMNLARLGCMRIFPAKNLIIERERQYRNLSQELENLKVLYSVEEKKE